MLEKIERRLLLINIAVFIAVLAVLSCAVYFYFKQSLYGQMQEELIKLADSAISSIDFDETGRGDAGKPDLIASVLPEEASRSLMELSLQWYDTKGKLSAQKGRLEIALPFSPSADLQEQASPHAFVLTRPAYDSGKLLGYVRVARPLAAADQTMQRLFSGLILAVVSGAIAGAAGISYLLKQSMAPIEESVRRIKQFSADASHELRTPIMAIKTNSSVALKYPEGMREKDRKKFLAIQDACEQMSRLTEDLLLLARVDDGRRSTEELELVDLQTMVKTRVEKWQAQYPGKTVKMNWSESENFMISGRSSELEKLFGNLIDNAFQYTKEGGEIRISTRRENGSIYFAIEDTGIGIEKEHLERIFDRFWRADRARNYREGGNGLGLSISKAVLDSYGGEIAVSSQPNSGSKFSVRLPAN